VSAIVFGGLVVMWVVVLVPMWLRRHDEVEETRSVDKFNSAMHTLSRREADTDKRYAVVPHRSRAVEVHVSGASAEEPRKLSATERRAARPVVTPAARRRRTLIALLVTTVVTAGLAVVVGGIALSALQIAADACLIAFVVHLRNRARRAHGVQPARDRPVVSTRAAAAPRRAASSAPVRRPVAEPLAEPEREDVRRIKWNDVPAAATASSFEPLFDQTAEFEETADLDHAAEFAFDQTAEFAPTSRAAPPPVEDVVADHDREIAYRHRDTRFDDPSFDRVVFDHTVAEEPAVARSAEVAAATDVEIDVPAYVSEPAAAVEVEQPKRVARAPRVRRPARTERVAASEPAAAALDDGIGERPWEPVPVPRPVYTTKPKAPKRRSRAPIMEPLLPPVDSAGELDAVDDLEEILDRRWAVND
jgi:hypothetical protein